MPQLELNQTPSIGSAVDVPNIVTSLNTNTGPTASASSFGVDLSGLAQGIDKLGSGLYEAADYQARLQHAKDVAQASDKLTDLNEGISEQAANYRAQGSYFPPDQFQSYLETQRSKLLSDPSAANNPRIQDMLDKGVNHIGLGYTKQFIAEKAKYQLGQTEMQVSNATQGLTKSVSSGSVPIGSAFQQLDSLFGAVAPALPNASSTYSKAQADLTTTGITRLAQTTSPGIAATAVANGQFDATSGGSLSDYSDSTSGAKKEGLITFLNSKERNLIGAHQIAANQQLADLHDKAATSPTSLIEAEGVAKNFSASSVAAPVLGKEMSIPELIDGHNTFMNGLREKTVGPLAEAKFKAYSTVEAANVNGIIHQKLLSSDPATVRNSVQQLQDIYGTQEKGGDPYGFVANAARYADNLNKLTAPGPNRDLFGATAMQTGISTAYVQASKMVNDAALSKDPVAMGAAEAQFRQVVQQSLSVQKSWGFQDHETMVMPASRAKDLQEQTSTSQGALSVLKNIQEVYGPYADKARAQVFSDKNGNVQPSTFLALMNPTSAQLWNDAKAVDNSNGDSKGVGAVKPTSDDEKAIFDSIRRDPNFKSFVQSHQDDPDRDVVVQKAMEGASKLAWARSLGTNVDTATAVKSIFNDTLGARYTAIPMGDQRAIAIPKQFAGNADEAKEQITKLDMILPKLITGDKNSGSTQEEEAASIMNNRFYNFNEKTNSYDVMVNTPTGSKPYLYNGNPLSIDAKGLKAAATGTPLSIGNSYPAVGDRASLFMAKELEKKKTTVLVDPQSLIVKPPTQVDTTPVLKTDAPPQPDTSDRAAVDQQPSPLAMKLPPGLRELAPQFEAYGAKLASQIGISPKVGAKLLAAISMHETGKGTSLAFMAGNNAMGNSDDNGPKSFANKEDSIKQIVDSISSNPAYSDFRRSKNILDLAKGYAPIGAVNDQRGYNKDWPAGVSKYYQELDGGT